MTLKIVILILEIIAQCLMLFPWSLFFLKKRGREVQSFLWQTLSKINIYERFYNYLLMDFTIQRVPKKIYDPKLERFVDYNRSEFLMPDSELRLKEEIEAIKKHVKIKDRPKFFRK